MNCLRPSHCNNFVLSKNGNLISSSGLPIQGYAIDPATGQADQTQLEDIHIDFNTKAAPVFTSSMTLNGNLDAAEKQLSYALKLTRGDYPTNAKINQRLADIAEIRAQMDA